MEPIDEPWLNIFLIILPLLLIVVFWMILFVVDQPDNLPARPANRHHTDSPPSREILNRTQQETAIVERNTPSRHKRHHDTHQHHHHRHREAPNQPPTHKESKKPTTRIEKTKHTFQNLEEMAADELTERSVGEPPRRTLSGTDMNILLFELFEEEVERLEDVQQNELTRQTRQDERIDDLAALLDRVEQIQVHDVNRLSGEVTRSMKQEERVDRLEKDILILHERLKRLFDEVAEDMEHVHGRMDRLNTRLDDLTDSVTHQSEAQKKEDKKLFAWQGEHMLVNTRLEMLDDRVDGLRADARSRLESLEGSRELLHGVIRKALDIVRDEDDVEGWMDVLREIGEDVRLWVAEDEEEEESEENAGDHDDQEEQEDDENEDEGYWAGGECRYQERYGDYNGTGDDEAESHDQEHRVKQRYEHWDWRDHEEQDTREHNHGSNGGQDDIADAQELLAEIEEARRFLSGPRELGDALCTELNPPPPTRADSPMPFVNGFFAPNPPEVTVPQNRREQTPPAVNRDPRPPVEDAARISLTMNEALSRLDFQGSRPEYYVDPEELEALPTWRRSKSEDDFHADEDNGK
jgi:hypothetical protein